MPIYEYECTKCGHRVETIQKVTDAPLKKCEKCKGKLERLISSPAIQFKGTGWYVTDYARKGGSGDDQGKKADSKSTTSEKSDSSGKTSSSKSKKEKASSSK